MGWRIKPNLKTYYFQTSPFYGINNLGFGISYELQNIEHSVENGRVRISKLVKCISLLNLMYRH